VCTKHDEKLLQIQIFRFHLAYSLNATNVSLTYAKWGKPGGKSLYFRFPDPTTIVYKMAQFFEKKLCPQKIGDFFIFPPE
jgi:hypothetical protein